MLLSLGRFSEEIAREEYSGCCNSFEDQFQIYNGN